MAVGVIAGLGLFFAVTAPADPPTLSLAASNAVIGQTIHATAQLSESPTATGEISFEVFGPGDATCAGPPLTPAPDPAPVSGDGDYLSGNFTPPTAGTYSWSAHYSGDLDNSPADAICAASSTVAKASPGLAGSASGNVVVGSAIHDEASLSGAFSPSGEVTFSVYAPGDSGCSTALATTTAPVLAGDASSPNFTTQQAGEFRWKATYPGDANNEAASTACGAVNQSSAVDKASPGLSGVATSAQVGQSIKDNATLSGGFSAGGQLVFRAYGPGDATCANAPAYEATVAVSGNGPYAPTGFAPGAGAYRWTVGYTGDGNNEATSTACGAANQSSTVGKASPTLTAAATSALVGQSITDNATFGASVGASGQLVFRAYGPGDATCANTPAYEANVAVSSNGPYAPAGFSPAPGSYRWKVEYAGDANNQAVSTNCGAANQTSTVSKATPTLVGSATSAQIGQTIKDNATLSGGSSAGGQLVFRAYGPGDATCAGAVAYEANVAVSGNGSYGPTGFSPAPGSYRWKVEYAGDANNEAITLACGAADQTSTVSKATPVLMGFATSAASGELITDHLAFSGGFSVGGQLVFRAYGPGDPTCAGAVAYEANVAVSGNSLYEPAGFKPLAGGLYLWVVEYQGDANNAAVTLACGAPNQSSAAGTVAATLTASAADGTIGNPVKAMATIQGAIPTGQITFQAFPPSDAHCSGAAAFSSAIKVEGNGSYSSAAFTPAKVGGFRWTVAYSGDKSHTPATVSCGSATSNISPASPSIAGQLNKQQVTVGSPLRDGAVLQGGYAPAGTVTFRIYGPVAAGCATPSLVDTVAISGNGTVKSDQFIPQLPGRYSFVASYSGDPLNQAIAEPCDSAGQILLVQKRTPQVKPRALLTKHRKISIRAHLSGGASPTGVINFRLYRPGDKRCSRRPAISGGISVKSNGDYSLAKYFATKRGVYRLSVGYSGDPRNKPYTGDCGAAQPIRVG